MIVAHPEIDAILAELSHLGVRLWVEGARLKVSAPKGAITPDLQARIALYKNGLLAALDKAPDTPDILTPRTAGCRIPLTLGQERLWSLARTASDGGAHNIPLAFRLRGALDIRALEAAIHDVAQRHSALRMVMVPEAGGGVHQIITPSGNFALDVHDISRDLATLDGEEAGQLIVDHLREDAGRPFDLERGPLWRARLYRAAHDDFYLLIALHHIVFDGGSRPILQGDLATSYRRHVRGGEEVDLPPGHRLEYADYAVWQRRRFDQAKLDLQLEFWRQQMAGEVAAPNLPTDYPRRMQRSSAETLDVRIAGDLAMALRTLATSEDASLFVLLSAAVKVALFRYARQRDMILCAPMANRADTQTGGVIGYFNNIVALRTELSEEMTFRELIARERRVFLDALDHQAVPFQSVAGLPHLARTSLTRFMLSLQESDAAAFAMDGLQVTPVVVRKMVADFEIALYLETFGDQIHGVLDYNADLFTSARMEGFVEVLLDTLGTAAQNTGLQLGQFAMVAPTVAEVAATIEAHPQIRQAYLLAHRASGELTAYLVLDENQVPALDDIKSYLQATLPEYRLPRLVPVDALPLNVDGSVDEAALPVPVQGRGTLGTLYAPPRDALETGIAAIWRASLWLSFDVGIHDRFRDLGGHSLLSAQMVVAVEALLGHPVPLRALSRMETIEEFAEAIRQGAADDADAGNIYISPGSNDEGLPRAIYAGLRSHIASWVGRRHSPEGLIVGLQTEGKRPPLFWCLQRYQELTQLAKYLGPGQPVYGMRSGHRVMVKSQENIRLLAACYAREIVEIDPVGPYYLGGNCQAALIIFEVAQALRRQGKLISLLIMHEKFVPEAYDQNVLLLFGKRSSYNPYLQFDRPELGWRRYYTSGLSFEFVEGSHGEFFFEPNIQVLASAITRSIEAARRGEFGTLPADPSAPTPLPAEACAALVETLGVPRARAGGTISLDVQVTNRSPYAWPASVDGGPVLAARWARSLTEREGKAEVRVPLAQSVGPGASVTMACTMGVPPVPGEYELVVDLLDEGVGWFGERGSMPFHRTVLVDGALWRWSFVFLQKVAGRLRRLARGVVRHA